jgi:hypothetical protein
MPRTPDRTIRYVVLYQCSGADDRIDSRHRTREAAERAARRAQRQLAAHNPGGNLLCGYVAASIDDLAHEILDVYSRAAIDAGWAAYDADCRART